MFGGSPPVNCAVCGTAEAYEWVGTAWRPISGADMSRIQQDTEIKERMVDDTDEAFAAMATAAAVRG